MTVLAVTAITGLTKAQLPEAKKLFSYERYNSAAANLRQTLEQTPNNAEAWFWLSRTQLAKDSLQAAKESFGRIPQEIKNDPYILVTQGALQLQEGDSTAAAASFAAAIGNGRKKNPAIQEAVGRAILDAPKGNLQEAINILQTAAEKDKKNPEVFIAIGDAYRKLYNGSEAARAYQAAIDVDASSAAAYYKLGKIYQTQNNADVFVEYYNKALAADANFAPVYYQLYFYNYFRDVNKANEYLQQYIAKTDADIKNEYLLTDLYYVSQKFNEAIAAANHVIATEGNAVKPRIYKLQAYSYEGLGNYTDAEASLKKYFSAENDTNYVAKDFDLMGKIAEKSNRPEEAVTWYEKAYNMEKDSAMKIDYTKKMYAFYKAQKDYSKQAYWIGQQYALHAPMSNVDLFNWGVAYYNAKDYDMADSVFTMYSDKYPEQTYGYYWRARSNAAIDTAMTEGLAIPHYEHLIDVAEKDTANANNKKWLIEAYGYLAAYKVNQEKLYKDALDYYDRILTLDPGNNDAEKYKTILEKMINAPKDNN